MGDNPVLESTSLIVQNSRFVTIDEKVLNDVAKRFAKEELKIPSWEEPVFLEGLDESTIDFFILGNSINFAYTDFETKQKFSAEYLGTEWRGAFGMWACLKRAVEIGVPLLDGEYLKDISEHELRKIFAGNFEMPLFEERARILREVGQVLYEKYGCHFHNLVAASNHRLFDGGNGLVERLTNDFPSFDDSAYFGTYTVRFLVRFNKRAQLAAGMLYGRFRNQGLFQMEDIDELTVFVDYVLPKALRDLGVLVYAESLAEDVDNQRLIEAKSDQELEIRAATLHASKMLMDKINEYRSKHGADKINALHVDYKLWSESRKPEGTPHHLTITTAY